MKTTRREFIRSSAMVGIGFLGLYKYAVADASVIPAEPGYGYGPLIPDRKRIFNLPKGFSYQIISKQGTPMSDGLLVPGKGDGMATFTGNNDRTILIRNHENIPNDLRNGPFGRRNELLFKVDKRKFYDYGSGRFPCIGGTTTLVYNHQTKKVEKEFLSLVGTIRNCAGGPTPWNSWITCEETLEKANGTLEKDHGYVFEVPATENGGLAEPIPIKAMGRFNHEAVAVDPKTGIVYLTEDDAEGLLYRFIPSMPGKLHQGGTLQALAYRDQRSLDTRNWEGISPYTLAVKKMSPVRWIDLDDIESPHNDLRHRGFVNGAARFARGEGMWHGNDEVYFACTNGGKKKAGQVFRYKPSPYEGTPRENETPGGIELFAEPNDKDILKYCDNLTIAPWGDVVLSEDDNHPFLVGITPAGGYYKLGENVGYESELAGAVFSPNGRTLFVNIQHAGLTLAIEGPWQSP
ncbi:MAG: PhoX family protein [Cyclobacteriaceae bacterium]|nr:PhoX family protein [Cyclobacteriaceae bacterium]MDH4297951.1 PhoX family protein [Cyclobacteriaceae bacterium]MDH5250675.1 PhoX family protein [Cyclobacteriaceae bacterium]